MKHTSLIITILMLFISSSAFAEKKEAEQNIPPQEIFDACVNKDIGESCSYTDNLNKTMNGKCVKDSRVVVCIPEPEPTHKE